MTILMCLLYFVIICICIKVVVYVGSFIFGIILGLFDCIGTTFLGQKSCFEEDEKDDL